MSEPQDPARTTIDAQTATVKQALTEIRLAAEEQAWALHQRGHQFGTDGQRMVADHAGETVPRYHPVWADEIRQALWQERRAGIETGPPTEPETNYAKWPTRFDPAQGRQELTQMQERLAEQTHTYQAQWATIETKLAAWQAHVTAHTQAQQPERTLAHDRSQGYER